MNRWTNLFENRFEKCEKGKEGWRRRRRGGDLKIKWKRGGRGKEGNGERTKGASQADNRMKICTSRKICVSLSWFSSSPFFSRPNDAETGQKLKPLVRAKTVSKSIEGAVHPRAQRYPRHKGNSRKEGRKVDPSPCLVTLLPNIELDRRARRMERTNSPSSTLSLFLILSRSPGKLIRLRARDHPLKMILGFFSLISWINNIKSNPFSMKRMKQLFRRIVPSILVPKSRERERKRSILVNVNSREEEKEVTPGSGRKELLKKFSSILLLNENFLHERFSSNWYADTLTPSTIDAG